MYLQNSQTLQEQISKFLVSGFISPSFERGLHKLEDRTELRPQLKLTCSRLEICVFWISWVQNLGNLMSESHPLWILFHTNQTLSPQQCLSGICCGSANALRDCMSFSCRQWDGDIRRGEIKVLSAFAANTAKTMSAEKQEKDCRLKNCRSCHYNWPQELPWGKKRVQCFLFSTKEKTIFGRTPNWRL